MPFLRRLLRLVIPFLLINMHPSLFAQSASVGFDVNDVTVLFPLRNDQQPSPEISLEDGIISPEIFQAVMSEATDLWISAPEGGSLFQKATWKVVALRYDPCGPDESSVGRGGSEPFHPKSKDSGTSLEAFFNHSLSEIQGREMEIATAIHRLENPALTNRNSADCLSCHAASSVRLERQLTIPGFIPGLSPLPPHRITAYPAPAVVSAHLTHWNLRALGYFDNRPALSLRTVHESGQVAETLNQRHGLNAPGRDCSTVAEEVMRCFVESSRILGPVVSKESCLNSCRL